MSAADASTDTSNSFISFPEFSRLIGIVWWPAVIGGVALGLLALLASFILDPVYRAQTVLEYVGDPTKQRTPQSGGGDLGSLAALAGINIGTEASPREAALATLRSRTFATDFIYRYELMPELNFKTWEDDVQEKTEQEIAWYTVEKFFDDVFRVSEDPKTGLITVVIEWRDPELAADWATKIVDMINERLKEIAVAETNRSLDHLKRQLEQAQNTELQRVIASLTESQIESLMYADIRDEFAFRTIDAPVAPPIDEYVFPSHLIFLILGIFLGGIAGAFAALMFPLAQARYRSKND